MFSAIAIAMLARFGHRQLPIFICYKCIHLLSCYRLYHRAEIPDIAGREEFKGKMIHSYQYRSPENFRDKHIVVVGAGPSGHDIALDVAQVAKKVIGSKHEPTYICNQNKCTCIPYTI